MAAFAADEAEASDPAAAHQDSAFAPLTTDEMRQMLLHEVCANLVWVIHHYCFSLS